MGYDGFHTLFMLFRKEAMAAKKQNPTFAADSPGYLCTAKGHIVSDTHFNQTQ